MAQQVEENRHLLNLAVAATVKIFESAFLQKYGGRGAVIGATSNGSSFGPVAGPPVVRATFAYGHEVPLVGDFDGNGVDDLVTFTQNTRYQQSGKGDVYVALNNATGCPNVPLTACLFRPQVSNDPIGFAAGKKAHGWFSVGGEVPVVGDFNGDGRDDIATFVQDTLGRNHANAGGVYVALAKADNSGTFGPTHMWISNGFSWGGEQVAAGDFDGDGKDDIATFGSGSSGEDVWVALSTGGSFAPQTRWASFFAAKGNWAAVGDFNGDGKDDIVNFVGDGPSNYYRQNRAVYVALSKVDSSGSSLHRFDFSAGATAPWRGNFAHMGERPAVGDFDGDGYADIITFLQDSQAGSARGRVYVGLNDKNGRLDGSGSGVWHDYFSIRQEVPLVGRFNYDSASDVVTLTR